MPTLVIDGQEFEVESPQYKELLTKLNQAFQVYELDEFQSVTGAVSISELNRYIKTDFICVLFQSMEVYTFETFISKCKEYNAKNPAGVVQYSEKLWGAVAYATRYFCLKKLALKFDSPKVRKEIVYCRKVIRKKGKIHVR